MKKPTLTNFAPAEIGLVIVLVAIIGGTGLYVYHAQHNANKTLDRAAKMAAAPVQPIHKNAIPVNSRPATNATLSLVSGNIGLNLTGWTAVDANAAAGSRCQAPVAAGVKLSCADNKLLIPTGSTFSSPDQFNVVLSTYKHGSASDPLSWLQGVLDIGGATNTPLVINGNQAVKSVLANPGGAAGTQVAYAVLGPHYDVLLYSDAFSGDHGTFKNTAKVDYQTFLPKIDSLAQSLAVK